jgi:hypothetical protein
MAPDSILQVPRRGKTFLASTLCNVPASYRHRMKETDGVANYKAAVRDTLLEVPKDETFCTQGTIGQYRSKLNNRTDGPSVTLLDFSGRAISSDTWAVRDRRLILRHNFMRQSVRRDIVDLG